MKGKVLLIDDDQAILQILSRALQEAGFETSISSQAIGTTNRVKEFAPDVIIMDVMMPALAGNKLVKLLKDTMDTITNQPIMILVSNKHEDELKKLAQECGADDYATKLSGPASVVRKVKECMARKKKIG